MKPLIYLGLFMLLSSSAFLTVNAETITTITTTKEYYVESYGFDGRREKYPDYYSRDDYSGSCPYDDDPVTCGRSASYIPFH